MSHPTTSLGWRQYGNQQYQMAGKVSTLTSAAELLKKAVTAYESALKLAADDEQRCFALRNLGMANWHLGKNCNLRAQSATSERLADGNTYHYQASHRTDYNPYVMLHFYKEAINAFARCVPLTSRLKSVHTSKGVDARGGALKRDTPTKFIEQLNKNMGDCAEEAISYLSNMDYFPTYKCRVDQLEHLINACGDAFRDWSAIFHLAKAKTYHKWAVTEMERSKNYATALHCLKECYSPLEIVDRLLGPSGQSGWFESDEFRRLWTSWDEWKDLKESVLADTAVAEALRSILEGDTLLHISIFDVEQPDIDGVHEAIDKYRAAVVILNDGERFDYSLEAEAYSKMGQAYFDILKNETRAKAHCFTAVHLANICPHQNFAGKDWFDKATAILKHIQDEVRRKEEEEVRKNREPYLKKLEKELAELKTFEEKSAETMIAELPKKFPPKHKAESKVLEELAKKTFTAATPRSEVKKALSKLILLFHPDHVDIKTHGGEYFVLCEEITKVITRKYEFFKG